MSGVPPAVKTALFFAALDGAPKGKFVRALPAFAIFAPCAQSSITRANAAEPRSPGRFPNLVPQFKMR
ncbi:MAG: hypothetical protein DBX55_08740 [Verrucomicrobia bacterium]|nr:MAG: hypothetical protein DBX55_08740 [Verrucomicrobiota bacterium]